MSDSDNAALARRWFEEVWNQRRHATVHELMHPESVGHVEGGDVVGPSGFLGMQASFLEAIPDVRVTVEATLARDAQVVVRWSARGTHTGDGLGVAPTSRPIAIRGITWLRIADGRIVEGWDSWNRDGLLQQLQRP